jgi:hypothetical protein
MDNIVKIKEKQGRVGKLPSYLVEMVEKYELWTGIEGSMVEEALNDLSGGLWTEIRKFEAQAYNFLESLPQLDGNLSNSDIKLNEHIKSFMKARVAEMWRDIIEHQKVGVDKLCIVTRKYIDDNKK